MQTPRDWVSIPATPFCLDTRRYRGVLREVVLPT